MWPLGFIGPTLAGVALFYLWPIAQTFYFSLTKWGVFGGVKFVGLGNFERLVKEPAVLQSLGNTAVYTLIVLLGIPIALVLAAMMERPGLKFARLYRTLYFIPYVTMPAAVGIVWRLIFNGDFGPVNFALGLVGIKGPYWTSTPGFALFAVAIVGLWMALGFNLIIISSGLREIPRELYEAAEIDGASKVRQFFSITLPLVTPSLFFLVVITTISGFQLFDLLYVMMGPGNLALPSSQSLVYIFYNEAFIHNDKGYASAIGVVIMAIICLLTFIQFKVQKKWVNYV